MLTQKHFGEIIEFKTARTLFGKPLYPTHFYFFDGLLIDTGPPHTSSEVMETVTKLPIKKVIITHQHEDHTGNCAVLQEKLGLPLYAHPETIRALANPPAIQIYRKIMWGDQEAAVLRPVGNFVDTDSYRLKVIHTGGHSADHTCYYEPENGWLFTGDFYLGENLNVFMAGENIVEHLRGLQTLISLEPKIIFCGLKGKLDNAAERLQRKYNSWWELCCKVIAMHNAGASRRKILKDAFGGEIFFFYFSQSNWGRRYMLDTIIDNLAYFQPDKKKKFLPYG